MTTYVGSITDTGDVYINTGSSNNEFFVYFNAVIVLNITSESGGLVSGIEQINAIWTSVPVPGTSGPASQGLNSQGTYGNSISGVDNTGPPTPFNFYSSLNNTQSAEFYEPYNGQINGVAVGNLWFTLNETYNAVSDNVTGTFSGFFDGGNMPSFPEFPVSFTLIDTATVPANPTYVPVVTGANITATDRESFTPSSLFSSVDAGGDITEYDVEDTGTGGGRFTLNGRVLAANSDNYITAAQLSELSYQIGAGTDTLMVRAYDPNEGWGPWSNGFTVTAPTMPPPPSVTTAEMIMSNPTNGDYEIYDIGGNAILAAYSFLQVPSGWSFSALGKFEAGDTADVLVRNSSTGAFEAYYVSGNTYTNSAVVGTVGLNWNFAGTGDFDGASSLSELLLRNSGNGSFELYQVAGGGVLSGSSVAAVGSNFSVEGFGSFSENGTTQMMMQGVSGASTGQLELYTYQPSTAAFAGIDVGDVGSNLTFLGCADLLGNGSTQMVMQQNNGDLWLYTYNAAANALGGQEVGAVGGNFHVVGFGPLGSTGRDEMLMQDSSGDFEVYQYVASENAFAGTSMGKVGAPWVVDGIAADPPSTDTTSASTAQVVQAMASIGAVSPASTGRAAVAVTETTTPPTLLTTPHV